MHNNENSEERSGEVREVLNLKRVTERYLVDLNSTRTELLGKIKFQKLNPVGARRFYEAFLRLYHLTYYHIFIVNTGREREQLKDRIDKWTDDSSGYNSLNYWREGIRLSKRYQELLGEAGLIEFYKEKVRLPWE